MNPILKRKIRKKLAIDAIHDTIDEVIDEHIDTDIYRELFPALSLSETTIDNPYFKMKSMTPKEGLTVGEYKTISYLGLFYKERVKYNPKEIVRYVRFLGYDIEDNDVTILVIDKEEAVLSYASELCNCVLEDLENG